MTSTGVSIAAAVACIIESRRHVVRRRDIDGRDSTRFLHYEVDRTSKLEVRRHLPAVQVLPWHWTAAMKTRRAGRVAASTRGTFGQRLNLAILRGYVRASFEFN